MSLKATKGLQTNLAYFCSSISKAFQQLGSIPFFIKAALSFSSFAILSFSFTLTIQSTDLLLSSLVFRDCKKT